VRLGSEVGAQAAQAAKEYFAAVTAVDEQIGRLLDELDDLGVADDTVVLFTSDHGMQLGSHDLMFKNVPYEESFLVPCVIRWPGHIPPGRDDALVGSVDVAPTLLGLLGLADQIPAAVQGTDCSPALRGIPGSASPQSQLYVGPAQVGGPLLVRGLRTRTHKLVVELTADETLTRHLFDLVADPYELSEVARQQPQVLAAMERELSARLAATGDPWPGRMLLRAAA
jgi:arylsulfatase A-like enzyme